MIRAVHAQHQCILTIADAKGKLAPWRLTLSDLEVYIVLCAGITHQEGNGLSRIKAEGEDKTPLDDEVPVLTAPQKLFTCAPKAEIIDLEFIEEPAGPFFLSNPGACMIADIKDNEKAKKRTLAELITAHARNRDNPAPFTSVRKLDTRLNVDSDGLLVVV